MEREIPPHKEDWLISKGPDPHTTPTPQNPDLKQKLQTRRGWGGVYGGLEGHFPLNRQVQKGCCLQNEKRNTVDGRDPVTFQLSSSGFPLIPQVKR